MAQMATWIEATRPKTLPAALSPVLLATALAEAAGAMVLSAALVCFLFALLVQVGTNFANDYLDGVRGSDTAARLGPARAVASGLVPPQVMRRAAIATLATAFCVGLLLIPYGGWGLLAVGVASIACAWLYTGGPYPLAYHALGDIFVVVFFGLVAVGASFYVQAGRLPPEALWLGLGCGLLVNNILVINNYRDLDEDRANGKRTLTVVLGRRLARLQYVLSAVAAGAVLIVLHSCGYGALVHLGWLAVVLALVQGSRLRHATTKADFLKLLQVSGAAVAAYGLLVATGLFLAR